MYITLKEFLDNDSVMGRLQSLGQYPIYETLDSKALDKMLIVNYGDRAVFDKLIGLTIDEICLQIFATYNKKWLDLINLNTMDIRYSSERVTEENNSNIQNSENSDNKDYKVSAYNTDELIINNSDSSINNAKSENVDNKLSNEKRMSLNIAFNNLVLSQKMNIINTVLKDVSSYLTLDIYL